MILLPFMDLPVVEVPTPDAMTRLAEIDAWAEDDPVRLSVAFLLRREVKDECLGVVVLKDYMLQIGFLHGNGIVTTKELILEVADRIWPKRSINLPFPTLLEVRQHLSLYFDKIHDIPGWGTNEYMELLLAGKTKRWLEGPHKRGKLRPNQRRWVVYDKQGEYVFGPLIGG